jgi:hypothetical protein
MQIVAQGWLIYRLSHSAFLLALDQFLGGIPIFLFSLIGGVVADRAKRRKIPRNLPSRSIRAARRRLLAQLSAEANRCRRIGGLFEMSHSTEPKRLGAKRREGRAVRHQGGRRQDAVRAREELARARSVPGAKRASSCGPSSLGFRASRQSQGV